MVKDLENQGHKNTASTRKVIVYVKKFFDCLNVKDKNEGARNRNDKLRPHVSAEDNQLKVCNLSLHNLTSYILRLLSKHFCRRPFSPKDSVSLLFPLFTISVRCPQEGYGIDVSRLLQNPFPTLFLTTEA